MGVAQSKLHYSVIAKKLGHPVDANFLWVAVMCALSCGPSAELWARDV